MRAIALVLALASSAHADIATAREKLGNGLTVVLAPDDTANTVVVHVRYEIGSADERANEAGFTHLVERLMGAGTVHVKDFEARITAAGGWTSSTTAMDHLSVFEEVPAGALELVLWLEAERMAGLADGITEAGLAREQAAIAAEWKSAYVEQPYALVARRVQERLWGGHLVLGDGKAVPAATLAAVRAFVRAHVVPRNATLVIAGRFDRAKAQQLVRKYFGWIPAGRPRSARSDVTPLSASSDDEARDPIERIVLAYRTPPAWSDEAVALEVAGHMLGGQRSHLQLRIVDQRLASEVHIEIVRGAAGGELHVEVVKPTDRAKIVREIRDEIAALARNVDVAEAKRAADATVVDLLVALEGLPFRADLLTTGIAPRALLRMFAAIDERQVQRAVAKWLTHAATVNGKETP